PLIFCATCVVDASGPHSAMQCSSRSPAAYFILSTLFANAAETKTLADRMPDICCGRYPVMPDNCSTPRLQMAARACDERLSSPALVHDRIMSTPILRFGSSLVISRNSLNFAVAFGSPLAKASNQALIACLHCSSNESFSAGLLTSSICWAFRVL